MRLKNAYYVFEMLPGGEHYLGEVSIHTNYCGRYDDLEMATESGALIPLVPPGWRITNLDKYCQEFFETVVLTLANGNEKRSIELRQIDNPYEDEV